MANIELSGGHIGIMIFTEFDKIELTGGYIEVIPFLEMEEID